VRCMGKRDHEADIRPKVAIITISTSRATNAGIAREPEEVDDESGKVIKDKLVNSGFDVCRYSLIPDDIQRIRQVIEDFSSIADVIITTGGTGLTPTDVTVEAVKDMFDKEIEGFGEIFRWLSYEEIGSSAILSRAIAGIWGETVVFCLPGSKKAVTMAMEKIILPELIHVVSHVKGLK